MLPKSAHQLRYWYCKWNRLFFDGTLPDQVVLLWEPVVEGVAECWIQSATHAYRDNIWYISIDPCLRAKKSLWGMALLHEMCHVALHPYDNHGKKFDAEMMRLASLGAFHDLW